MVITICIGSSCHLKGSREVIANLEALVAEHSLDGKIEMEGSFCLNQCVKGVCVRMEDEIFSLTPATTTRFFENEVLPRVEKL